MHLGISFRSYLCLLVRLVFAFYVVFVVFAFRCLLVCFRVYRSFWKSHGSYSRSYDPRPMDWNEESPEWDALGRLGARPHNSIEPQLELSHQMDARLEARPSRCWSNLTTA